MTVPVGPKKYKLADPFDGNSPKVLTNSDSVRIADQKLPEAVAIRTGGLSS
ncbi:hypothetical protein Poly51_23580 [Rubripirellula tenax]|uniref:Uncharacterized protein n=1 Tax=Rubripirellula tenax TaxID=2528015 RepID=A0A5C6F7L6_9BACT|nr:hypothetical protein Poly51_23580 [Rubripirellula tenax]